MSVQKKIIAAFGNDSNGFEISANILTSAYGKDSFKTFIERNISQGAVLYADKAKSQALFKTPGLQLPDNFNSLDFDIIIRKTNAFVNRDEQKSSEKSKRSPLLINLFAGPSAGKTTAALELTAALKKKGFNVEYVSEYAKELVLENKTELLKNQVHVTDEQFHRLDRLRNSGVEIIVTDSPVLLGKVYGEGKISREYGEKLLTYHNSFCCAIKIITYPHLNYDFRSSDECLFKQPCSCGTSVLLNRIKSNYNYFRDKVGRENYRTASEIDLDEEEEG